MSFNSRRVATAAVAGNLDTLVAGTVTGGTSLNMNQVEPDSLCARVTVDVETNTITVAAIWQVSNDNSTWINCANGPQNAATVVLGTGTAGADASIDKVIDAPASVYSFPYARCAVTNAVATGAAVDTYSITTYYMKPKFYG